MFCSIQVFFPSTPRTPPSPHFHSFVGHFRIIFFVNKFSMQIATVKAVDKYSFPSGHASRAMFVATFGFLTHSASPISYALYVWAFIVGISRVCFGRHYLSDVVAGLVLGLMTALLVVWVIPPLLFDSEWLLPLHAAAVSRLKGYLL
jgi:membrane-associated phospholipid phosphatase